MTTTTMSALASAPLDAGLYTSPIKIAVVVLLLAAWALVAQWVDRDTDVVKTRREHWNMMVLSGGFVGFIALFVPPWQGSLFYVGVLFWLLIAGGPIAAYVIHRNGRVVPAARVLTIQHLKSRMGGGPKKVTSAKGVRVQISDHEGKFVEAPSDPEELKDFDAVQDFMFDLMWRRASDADMLVGKEKYRLVYKIDGVATERPEGVTTEEGQRIFRFLKKAAGLNVEEIRRPQSGKIRAGLLSGDGNPGQTEVHTSGTMAGERLRVHFQCGPSLMRLPEIGLPAARMEQVKQFMAKQKGLFIISAPPAHGLTSTQYAILRTHDAYINNIHALERKPLLDLDNITQQLYEDNKSDVGYARMLQTVLRREPDIVLVDLCEDRETAMIATRAALEDRKIYFGLHSKDTFDALSKYLQWIEDQRVAAKALLGVMNQRLVRVLCTECREAFRPDPATLKKLNLPADKIEKFYRPPTEQKTDRKGRPILCTNCQGTGYVNRTGVFELLVVDDAIRQLISEKAPMARIKAQCRKNKMYYLQEEGLLKVIDGTTSMNEILRCLRADTK
jgi:type II secretory ATPase GspE/PulE/Tfp pilus assembly ATPase PilB-like protein